jgi:hypothetical protein
MVTAVELDNQPLLDATQICEVGINAVLSPEFEPAKALGSEVLPKQRFRLGTMDPKKSRSIPRVFTIGNH